MRQDALRIPHHVEDAGSRWTITRAWPARDGSITVEAANDDSPHVRGGTWDGTAPVDLRDPGVDPRLPGLAPVAATGTVVSHRPGRRAVVRSGDGQQFTKVVRPGRGAGLLAAARTAEAFAVHLAVPRVVAGTDDRLVLGALPGRSLLRLAGEADEDDWDRAWSDWAESWTRLARGCDPSTATHRHDARAEVQVLRDWRDKAGVVLEAPSRRRLHAVVDAVGRRLEEGPAAPLVLAHRDLHDQQLLWDPDHGTGILDVDTLAAAEAALDLGNLRAHLHLRVRQGLCPADRAARARMHVDAVARALDVPQERLLDHQAATLARLACVYAFRPRWRTVAATLLDEVAPAAG